VRSLPAGPIDELGDVQPALAIQQQQEESGSQQQEEEGGSHQVIASFTQLRSSVPLLWSSPPDLSPRPAVTLCLDSATQQAAIEAHVQQLKESYQVRR
jgi:hypothetical protein